MDACTPAAAAAAARWHAVPAARVAGVAEASVRAVRLCAESGGLVLICVCVLLVCALLVSYRR